MNFLKEQNLHDELPKFRFRSVKESEKMNDCKYCMQPDYCMINFGLCEDCKKCPQYEPNIDEQEVIELK